MGLDLGELKVLVAEDQALQRELLTRTLTTMGVASVQGAADGREALDLMMADAEIDLLITDLQMPVMDGIELLRHVGEIQSPPQIIVVSAEDPAILGAAGRVAKENGLHVLGSLEKPVTRLKIQKLLEARRNREIGRSGGAAPLSGILERAEFLERLDGGALEVQIQPKANLLDGRIEGGEALMRLRNDDGSLMPPSRFIPLVEAETALGARVTTMIADKVASVLQAWPSGGTLPTLSVNVPAACLSLSSTTDQLSDAVLSKRVPAKHITWEVTETATIANFAVALEALTRLRLKGFGLSIDDYGTGHSSLDRLCSIPFSEVKLDQIFVRGCASNQSAQKVIASTAALAKDLKMKSVGEGAETEDEVMTLRDLGFDIVQGYAISRPLDIGAFVEFAGAD